MKEPIYFQPRAPEEFWICACVKRNRKGLMTHIKSNHPSVKKCRKCGCTKEKSDAIGRKTGS